MLPKAQGGLSSYSLVAWNLAVLANKIWRLFCDGEALWVQWIHAFYIKRTDFWSMEVKDSTSLVWKRTLQARNVFRDIVLNLLIVEKFSLKEAYFHCVKHEDTCPWHKLL